MLAGSAPHDLIGPLHGPLSLGQVEGNPRFLEQRLVQHALDPGQANLGEHRLTVALLLSIERGSGRWVVVVMCGDAGTRADRHATAADIASRQLITADLIAADLVTADLIAADLIIADRVTAGRRVIVGGIIGVGHDCPDAAPRSRGSPPLLMTQGQAAATHTSYNSRSECLFVFRRTVLTMFVSLLVPQLPGFRLDNVQMEEKRIVVSMTATSRTASCPICAQDSERIHSHYQRTVTDLPWASSNVRLRLYVRRFKCSNPDCARTIFAERLDPLVPASARRTRRFTLQLLHLAMHWLAKRSPTPHRDGHACQCLDPAPAPTPCISAYPPHTACHRCG